MKDITFTAHIDLGPTFASTVETVFHQEYDLDVAKTNVTPLDGDRTLVHETAITHMRGATSYHNRLPWDGGRFMDVRISSDVPRPDVTLASSSLGWHVDADEDVLSSVPLHELDDAVKKRMLDDVKTATFYGVSSLDEKPSESSE